MALGDQQDRPGEIRELLGLTQRDERRLSVRRDVYDLCGTRSRLSIPCANGLSRQVPDGPWLYPEDQIADLPLRMIAAEMTREKLTLRLHQELPYQLTVETENWEERKDGSAVSTR